MKLAFSSNAFKKYSIEECINQIATIGYEGIEILCDIPHAFPGALQQNQKESILESIKANNLLISNLNAFTMYAVADAYHPSWIESDPKLREIRVKHTTECISLAKELGAQTLSTEPGGIFNKRTNNRRELKKLFISSLSKVVRKAEIYDIKILIEPEPNLLLEDSSDFLKFIKAIDSDMVKLNFDIGHFYCMGEDPASLIYKLSEYIEHFHLADIANNRIHNHLIPGEGAIDFNSVFNAIAGVGYKGFVTVELYPYQDDPIYAAKRAHDYLKAIYH